MLHMLVWPGHVDVVIVASSIHWLLDQHHPHSMGVGPSSGSCRLHSAASWKMEQSLTCVAHVAMELLAMHSFVALQ
jgi:hypothetical protein